MKKFKLTTLIFLTTIMSIQQTKAQIPVAQTMFAFNVWFVDMQTNPVQGMNGLWKLMAESGVRYVRIGGIEPNFRPGYVWSNSTFNITSYTGLRSVIDSIKYYGMTPIIQVGYNPVCNQAASLLSGVTRANQAKIAGSIVDKVNNVDG